MSTPVDNDTIAQGAVMYLSGFDDVLDVLGTFPNTTTPYLFQQSLWVAMEGTSSTAAVLSRAGGWAGPNVHNTLRFPRLQLEMYCDPLRDDDGNVTDPAEAERRIEAAYRVLDSHLHRPQSGIQMWGAVRTIACARQVEPVVYPVPDGGGLLRLLVFYGVTEG